MLPAQQHMSRDCKLSSSFKILMNSPGTVSSSKTPQKLWVKPVKNTQKRSKMLNKRFSIVVQGRRMEVLQANQTFWISFSFRRFLQNNWSWSHHRKRTPCLIWIIETFCTHGCNDPFSVTCINSPKALTKQGVWLIVPWHIAFGGSLQSDAGVSPKPRN